MSNINFRSGGDEAREIEARRKRAARAGVKKTQAKPAQSRGGEFAAFLAKARAQAAGGAGEARAASQPEPPADAAAPADDLTNSAAAGGALEAPAPNVNNAAARPRARGAAAGGAREANSNDTNPPDGPADARELLDSEAEIEVGASGAQDNDIAINTDGAAIPWVKPLRAEPTVRREPGAPPARLLSWSDLLEFASIARGTDGLVEFRMGLPAELLNGLRITLVSHGRRRVALRVEASEASALAIGEDDVESLAGALRRANLEVVDVSVIS